MGSRGWPSARAAPTRNPKPCLQLLVGLFDLQLDLQPAMEAPRWVHAAPGDRFPRDAVVLESRFGPQVADEFTRVATR